MALLWYGVGIFGTTQKELKDLDVKPRKLMMRNGMFDKKDNVNGLYLKKADGG